MKNLGAVALILMFMVCITFIGCINSGNLSSGIGAGSDAMKAASLSDEEVKQEAMAAIGGYDKAHKVAPSNNPYRLRQKKITSKHLSEEDLDLNYQVYLTDQVYAFAMADGSIRVYSGLMDMMTDDELLFVIGHEIAHVKLGHRKKALQVAYAASAAKKGASAKGGKTGAIANSALGDFAEKLINAQFSQKEESNADQYGLNFLKKNNYNPQASVSALKKIEGLGSGNHGILSSHPDSGKRADKLEASL